MFANKVARKITSPVNEDVVIDGIFEYDYNYPVLCDARVSLKYGPGKVVHYSIQAFVSEEPKLITISHGNTCHTYLIEASNFDVVPAHKPVKVNIVPPLPLVTLTYLDFHDGRLLHRAMFRVSQAEFVIRVDVETFEIIKHRDIPKGTHIPIGELSSFLVKCDLYWRSLFTTPMAELLENKS